MAEFQSKTGVPLTHLDNRIHDAVGTVSHAEERQMERREEGLCRSDPRIPLTLSWLAGRNDAAQAQ